MIVKDKDPASALVITSSNVHLSLPIPGCLGQSGPGFSAGQMKRLLRRQRQGQRYSCSMSVPRARVPRGFVRLPTPGVTQHFVRCPQRVLVPTDAGLVPALSCSRLPLSRPCGHASSQPLSQGWCSGSCLSPSPSPTAHPGHCLCPRPHSCAPPSLGIPGGCCLSITGLARVRTGCSREGLDPLWVLVPEAGSDPSQQAHGWPRDPGRSVTTPPPHVCPHGGPAATKSTAHT